MIIMANIITFVLSLFPFYKSIKALFSKKFVLLHIASIVFFVMQVVPLIIETIRPDYISVSSIPNLYLAITDLKTTYVYDFFAVCTLWLMFVLANIQLKKNFSGRNVNIEIYNEAIIKNFKTIIVFILEILSFLPIVAVIFSPRISVYLKFSYFYTNDYLPNSLEYVYHNSIIQMVNFIATIATISKYFLYNKKGISVSTVLSTFFITWIDGKRALLVFIVLGIVLIDVVKRRHKKNELLKKIIFLAVLVFIYLVIYQTVTLKGDNHTFFESYNSYFAREFSVKTAIYAKINGDNIVQYPGQTILYNLFFFVPRNVWGNKPYLYCKYFTAYSYDNTSGFLSWNLQVNIWTEFISNFGLFGILIAVFLIVLLSKLVENSKSIFTYLLGIVFVSFYLMFGFETMTIAVYIALILSFVFGLFLKKKKSTFVQIEKMKVE